VKVKTIIVLCFYFSNVLVTLAQDDSISIYPEFRTLSIIDGGYKSLRLKEDSYYFYTSQRIRLNLGYSLNNFESYLSIQDVRLWGDDNKFTASGNFGNTESLSVYQAWVKYKCKSLFLMKIGRQILSYDDQRILSSRGWNDYQLTYDAFLFEYKTDLHRIHIGLSCNNSEKKSRLYPSRKNKLFDFAHYQIKYGKVLYSFISVITGNAISDTSSIMCYRGTHGFNVKYKNKSLNARMSVYYQHSIKNASNRISAYCLSLLIENEFGESFKAGFGLDYISGNNQLSNSCIDNRFDILYGRRHGFYGYLDYFSTTPEQGLQDYMIKISYKTKNNISFFVDWHYFMILANAYEDNNSLVRLDSRLGQECDFKLAWHFSDQCSVNLGYSIYYSTNTFRQIKQVSGLCLPFQHFSYLMLSYHPIKSLIKNK